MNNLEFRAWDNYSKEWLLGYDYKNLGGFSLFGECMLFKEWSEILDLFLFEREGRKAEDLIVTQYTGFRDINDKKIFSGDIIKSPYHVNPSLFEIKFTHGAFCTTHPLIKNHPIELNHFFKSEPYSIEVIGNIFENPYLLIKNE